jgi:hypothetical protein
MGPERDKVGQMYREIALECDKQAAETKDERLRLLFERFRLLLLEAARLRRMQTPLSVAQSGRAGR